ncbi:MAG: O-antigen ligase family protein [Micromonosporaceae bacterium]
MIASLLASLALFGGYLVLADWRYRLAGDVIAAAVLLVWLVLAARDTTFLPSTRLMPAVVACLLAFCISTLASANVRLSAEMLGYAVLLVLLYMLLVRLMTDAFWRPRFGTLIVVLTLVIGSVYMGVTLLSWVQWWDLVGRITMPPLRPAYGGLAYGSPNVVAALLLTLGATASAVLGWSTRLRRISAGVLVALVGSAVAVTGSRGAWLGAVVGIVTLASAWVMVASNRRRLTAAVSRVPPRLRLGIALLLSFAAVVVFFALRSRLSLADYGLRQTFFEVSLGMFQSSPITGIGPGMWPVKRALFTSQTGVDFWNPHAQSVYLQTIAEFGAVGVVAAFIVVSCLVWVVRDGIRSPSPERRRVGYATLFVLAAMATQQTVDFLANVPALLVALALPVAWLDATASEPPWARIVGRWRLPARPVALAMASAVLVVAAGLIRIESVAATASRGIALGESGDWASALPALELAARADPDVPIYWFRLGLAAANTGQHALAREAFARSTEMDGLAVAWMDLAAEDLAAGDSASARSHVIQGERLGWQDAAAMVAAADVRHRLGDREMAVRDAGYAIQDAPSLASDAAGWAMILPGIPVDELVDSSLADLDRRRATFGSVAADSTRGAIAVFASRPAVATEATDELRSDGVPADVAGVPTVAERAWAGDGAAVTDLEDIARDWPANNGAISWLALLSERSGDLVAVARYRWQAMINSPFAVNSAWSVMISAWTPVASLRAAPTGQYASAYRRIPVALKTTRALPALEQY